MTIELQHRIDTSIVLLRKAEPLALSMDSRGFHLPKVEKTIVKSIQHLIDTYGYFNNHNATAQEVFDWWVSNKSAAEYFGAIRNQLTLF